MYIHFKNYFTPHVQYSHPPASLRWLSHHTGHVWVHITDSTDQRSIFVIKWWHYIRDNRKVQGAYKLSGGNRTGIWLECGMRSTKEAVGVWGHMQRCLLLRSRQQSGNLALKSRLRRDTYRSVLQVILSCISLQIFQVELWHVDRLFLSLRWRCAFLSVCQVLRALVHSVLLSLWICMPECLPVDVHYSVCTSVSETACVLRCGTDYRKALGFARGSFWFL